MTKFGIWCSVINEINFYKKTKKEDYNFDTIFFGSISCADAETAIEAAKTNLMKNAKKSTKFDENKIVVCDKFDRKVVFFNFVAGEI